MTCMIFTGNGIIFVDKANHTISYFGIDGKTENTILRSTKIEGDFNEKPKKCQSEKKDE